MLRNNVVCVQTYYNYVMTLEYFIDSKKYILLSTQNRPNVFQGQRQIDAPPSNIVTRRDKKKNTGSLIFAKCWQIFPNNVTY